MYILYYIAKKYIHVILSRCFVWMCRYVCARLSGFSWQDLLVIKFVQFISHIADFLYIEVHGCIFYYWYMYFHKRLFKSFVVVYSPVPSLPTTNGLPPTRSPRPYTTFELDQIRQHAKRYFLLSITLARLWTNLIPVNEINQQLGFLLKTNVSRNL